ncbi:MAG TPA: family 16 glycoside hydrolase [Gemmataceae bacterium]|nr:family 16 glycoside hydrolase [Gemmataceae bacterium]
MPAPTVSHPVDDALSAYGRGQLDARVAAAIARHLSSCAPCRGRVAALTAAQPTTASRVAASPLAGLPNYRIERRLGEGGMGEVYLAHNLLMDRPEVLKIIHKELIDRAGAVERFLQEVRNAARLQHPNIVAAYTCMQSKDILVLSMEYVPGQNLAEHVRSTGPLPVVHACHYVQQVALGLQHAHERNTVHRDIKPHNLMLARDGKKHVVKVLDFGLAKVTSERSRPGGLTSDGRMMGTPDYVAPEQISDAARADIRADIYSLGCTLYFLLTGRPPFAGSGLYEILKAHHDTEATPVHELRPDVPPALSAVVAKMMTKAPANRYQTPAEVAVALHALAQGEPVPPGPVTTVEQPTPDARSTAAALSGGHQTVAATPAPYVYGPPPPGRRVSTAVLVGLAAFGLMSVGALLAWKIGLFAPQAVGYILLPGFPEGGSVLVDDTPARVDRDPDTGLPRVLIYVRTEFVLVVRDRTGQVVHRSTQQVGKGTFMEVAVPRPTPPPGPRQNGVPQQKSERGPVGPIGGNTGTTSEPESRPAGAESLPPKHPLPPAGNVVREVDVPTLPPGYTPLFDGRTTAGWRKAAGWEVKDGILVGRGADGLENLFTVQDDFADFELWAEVKVEGGDSGLFFRVKGEDVTLLGPVVGYEAQLTGRAKDIIPTGSLALGGATKSGPKPPRDVGDRFFVILVRAVARRITVHVDDAQTAAYEHTEDTPARGAIAFQLLDRRTVVRIRRIGIKRLYALKPEDSTTTKLPKTTKRQLFHAADLPGQEFAKGGWIWRSGQVTGHTIEKVATNRLFLYSTEKFKNFELEFEVRCSSKSTRTGVQIRSARTDKPMHGMIGPQVEIASTDALTKYGLVTFNPEPPRDAQRAWPVTVTPVALHGWKFPDWNMVVIRCVGSRVRVTANGHVLVDREVPGLPEDGLIGLKQPYAFGEPASATFRNVFVTDLSGSK